MTSTQNWGTWVRVKWKPGTPTDAWQEWKDNKSIKGFWSTSGSWDALLWLEQSDPSSIESLVLKDLRSSKWVEDTETSWSKKCW